MPRAQTSFYILKQSIRVSSADRQTLAFCAFGMDAVRVSCVALLCHPSAHGNERLLLLPCGILFNVEEFEDLGLCDQELKLFNSRVVSHND